MTYIAKPKFHHPGLPKNSLGYTHRDYEGKISTLCAGCGHDSITASIIEACYELSIEPHRVAKISGIGCSSKTTDYFLNASHGFNSVHGRMPSVLTGANLANRDLIYLGVSGDGDTASIGLGQFAHAMRRGVNMVYIVENNGVYGLTKGQFSATADKGSKAKKGAVNAEEPIDLVQLAQPIEHLATPGGRDARRVLEIEHGVGPGAELDPLMDRRQEPIAPEPGVQRLVGPLLADQHAERRQVAVRRSQAVTQPGSDRRPAGDRRARLEEGDRRVVVDRLGEGRADETDVVDHPGRLGQELADPAARRSMPRELEDRPGKRQGCLVARHARQPLAHPDRIGQVLAVHPVEQRLVIEQVKLRRPATHEQVDDPPGSGREVRRRQHAPVRRVD